jgi:class 3 adenylate cyclase
VVPLVALGRRALRGFAEAVPVFTVVRGESELAALPIMAEPNA